MERIDKYIVLRELVVSRFSTVFLCRDPDLEVAAAVKLFAPHDAGSDTALWLERFVAEARLLARTDHPRIVGVRELSSTDDGRPYFVMPFVEANLTFEIGLDQADADREPRWQPRPIPRGRAVQVLGQVLEGLAHLHSLGIVHRDIKPSNILLTGGESGRIKICDLGMARIPGNPSTTSGAWTGTPGYMAPEIMQNAHAADARADVYAAGALAWRMLTGRLPDDGDRPDIPGALGALIRRALSPRREDRPRDAGEMHKLLLETLVPWAPMAKPAKTLPPPRVGITVKPKSKIKVKPAFRASRLILKPGEQP